MGTDETVASAAMDLSERGSAAVRHPWELERFRAYRSVLADHGALRARRVLDVGAGDGWFSEQLVTSLPDVREVVCWDINYHELELRTDDPRLVRTTDAPSPGFDLVLVLDVLEHIDDPIAFIHDQLRPLTDPGTTVLAAVPAHPLLFGDHDRALGHVRRYRRRDLLTQLGGWLDVVEHGSLFTTLVPPRAAGVLVERCRPPRAPRSHGVGDWHGGPAVTAAVRGVLRADAALARRLGSIGVPVPGLSVWAYGIVR
jgi:hypothetical protein